MAFDIAIDNNGDLVFAGNRDLLSVREEEVIQQRIRIRLLIPLGSMTFDGEEIIGSDIYAALRYTEIDEKLFDDLALRIQESLTPMEDIVLSDVRITVNSHKNLEIIVVYSIVPDIEEPLEVVEGEEGESQILTVEIPTGEGA